MLSRRRSPKKEEEMALHDFQPLFDHYPEMIAQMPGQFTSHEFILRLAQCYQTQYIEALFAYRESLRMGTPAPFLIVHGQLAQQLGRYPALLELVRNDAPSRNIFGEQDWCGEWRKKMN
jgi:hypothetical protein